jgi:hypothetical protein
MIDFPETEWTDERGETWTRQEFLDKMHWEGGVAGMVGWGGPSCFPPSLREMAQQIETAEFGATSEGEK